MTRQDQICAVLLAALAPDAEERERWVPWDGLLAEALRVWGNARPGDAAPATTEIAAAAGELARRELVMHVEGRGWTRRGARAAPPVDITSEYVERALLAEADIARVRPLLRVVERVALVVEALPLGGAVDALTTIRIALVDLVTAWRAYVTRSAS